MYQEFPTQTQGEIQKVEDQSRDWFLQNPRCCKLIVAADYALRSTPSLCADPITSHSCPPKLVLLTNLHREVPQTRRANSMKTRCPSSFLPTPRQLPRTRIACSNPTFQRGVLQPRNGLCQFELCHHDLHFLHHMKTCLGAPQCVGEPIRHKMLKWKLFTFTERVKASQCRVCGTTVDSSKRCVLAEFDQPCKTETDKDNVDQWLERHPQKQPTHQRDQRVSREHTESINIYDNRDNVDNMGQNRTTSVKK